MVVAVLKIGFGLITAAVYAFAAQTMISGATGTVNYVPNDMTTWFITIAGGAIIAFIASQIGVAVATPDGGGRNTVSGRLRAVMFDADDDKNPSAATQNKVAATTMVVLVVDALVLIGTGAFFVWLSFKPQNIAVAEGARKLTDAPKYITTQTQTIFALVFAGGAGTFVGAKSN